MTYHVTAKEYFKDLDTSTLSDVQLRNSIELLVRVNMLRVAYNKPLIVTSGYRSPEHNAKIGGAPKSNHVQCAAIDFADADGSLKRWLMADDNKYLKQLGLYMEDPKDTPTWCHVQIVPPNSGKRVFGR